jgi:hypothetical protein
MPQTCAFSKRKVGDDLAFVLHGSPQSAFSSTMTSQRLARQTTLACLTLAGQLLAFSSLQAQPNSASKVIWAEDALSKVMSSATGNESKADRLLLSGARREIVSGQAVFRPQKGVATAQAEISDLRHRGSGAILPGKAVQLQWVRSIAITRNSDIPPDERVAQAPASIPDPFWEEPAIPVVATQAQPLWIELHVPEDAAAGDYDGRLTVKSDGDLFTLPVSVHVWDFALPAQQHLSVVNWWRFPGTGFEDHGPDDWDLLRRFAAFLVEHGQTDLQTEISRIRESGDARQGYAYDTSRLERYAEAAFGAGIRQIHLHSVGRRTADILNPQARVEVDEPNLRRLAAWEKVMQRRGWQRRFVVSIVDEPFVFYEDSYSAVVDRVHQVAPSVRCLEAVEAEYLGKLDVYVPKLSHLSLWYPRFEQARKEGAELWYYVCCHPLGRYPNRFLDQPLLKARVLFWIHYLYNLDGYLHWGLNHFAGDPYTQEGISKDLPLGDRAIVYPGKQGLIGSLRLSTQRDGIQDYEYMRVLEERLRQIKGQVGQDGFWIEPRQRSLELCRRVIWSCHDHTRDRGVLLDTRRAIAEEVEGLQSEPRLVVQTSPPEGTVVPAGPRAVNLRGWAPPGSKILVNGQAVNNARPSGYFCQAVFLGDNQAQVVVVVEHEGRKGSAVRSFQLAD